MRFLKSDPLTPPISRRKKKKKKDSKSICTRHRVARFVVELTLNGKAMYSHYGERPL
jgi:hypothetical protein